jgi:hypothetical protein
VPASSKRVEDIEVVDSAKRGGRILVMTPKYKESSSMLAVSRSSLIVALGGSAYTEDQCL